MGKLVTTNQSREYFPVDIESLEDLKSLVHQLEARAESGTPGNTVDIQFVNGLQPVVFRYVIPKKMGTVASAMDSDTKAEVDSTSAKPMLN
jgi:hypothetical protein